MTKKFKKKEEHKARDKTQGEELSDDWDNVVYPFPILKPKKSKVIKEK